MELPAGLIALRKLVSIGAIANGNISSLAVLPGVMQSRLEFLILTKGLEFYRDRLCHEQCGAMMLWTKWDCACLPS